MAAQELRNALSLSVTEVERALADGRAPVVGNEGESLASVVGRLAGVALGVARRGVREGPSKSPADMWGVGVNLDAAREKGRRILFRGEAGEVAGPEERLKAMILVCESFFALEEAANGEKRKTECGEKESAAYGLLELCFSAALKEEAEFCCSVLGELLSMALSTQCSLFLHVISQWWERRHEKERTCLKLAWRVVRPSLVVKLSQDHFLSLQNTSVPQLIFGTLIDCLWSLSLSENVSDFTGTGDVIQPLAPSIYDGLQLWCQVLGRTERALHSVTSFIGILMSDSHANVRAILGPSTDQRFILFTAFLEVVFQWGRPLPPTALPLMLTGKGSLESFTVSPVSLDDCLTELRVSLVSVVAANFEKFPAPSGEVQAQRSALARALATAGEGERWTALVQRIASS